MLRLVISFVFASFLFTSEGYSLPKDKTAKSKTESDSAKTDKVKKKDCSAGQMWNTEQNRCVTKCGANETYDSITDTCLSNEAPEDIFGDDEIQEDTGE